MTERELRKLNRTELLEMLIGQIRENEALQTQLDEANEKLARRAELAGESGSIAEAALRLNGVFEAAQAAAEHYLESVRAANPAETLTESEKPAETPTESEEPAEIPADCDEIAAPARSIEPADEHREVLV